MTWTKGLVIIGIVVVTLVPLIAIARMHIQQRRQERVRFHPDRLIGEEFIGNFTEQSYQRLHWKTKRKGGTAYDGRGRPLPAKFFPVFVKLDEYTSAMKQNSGA